MTEWRDTDHIDPGGHWMGWKLRGRVLISPDHDRITPERLRGLLFSESLRLRRDKTRNRTAQVITLSNEFRKSVKSLSGCGTGLVRHTEVAVAAHLLAFDGSVR